MAAPTFTIISGTISHTGDVDGIGLNETIIHTATAGRLTKVYFEMGSSTIGKTGFLADPALAAQKACTNTDSTVVATEIVFAENRLQGGDDLSSAFLFVKEASILAAYDTPVANWSAVIGGPIPTTVGDFNLKEDTIFVANTNVTVINTGIANAPIMKGGDTITFNSNLITATAASFANCVYNMVIAEEDI